METKEEKYRRLLPAARALMDGEADEIARMANLAALLHREFGFWWTGFYRVADEDTLVLGPFQGPLACTRIPRGKGVCGSAWSERRSIVVPDVSQFKGHIACSSESRSEIVIPLWRHGAIAGVLDIDSRELGAFDETDRTCLERIAACIYGPEREIWMAGGCFWGVQKFFKLVDGVISTETGYANGRGPHPTYAQVKTDTTGFAECVHIRYNPERVSLGELTQLFFRIIDPLSLNRQGEDEGTQYRTGIYYQEEQDRDILAPVFDAVKKDLGVEEIPVELQPLNCFYRAEEYHQDYLDKHPDGYCHLSGEVFALARHKASDSRADDSPGKAVSR